MFVEAIIYMIHSISMKLKIVPYVCTHFRYGFNSDGHDVVHDRLIKRLKGKYGMCNSLVEIYE